MGVAGSGPGLGIAEDLPQHRQALASQCRHRADPDRLGDGVDTWIGHWNRRACSVDSSIPWAIGTPGEIRRGTAWG